MRFLALNALFLSKKLSDYLHNFHIQCTLATVLLGTRWKVEELGPFFSANQILILHIYDFHLWLSPFFPLIGVNLSHNANFSPMKNAGDPCVAKNTLYSACNYLRDYMYAWNPCKSYKEIWKILIKSIYKKFTLFLIYFKNYRDYGYTCNPRKFEIPTLRWSHKDPLNVWHIQNLEEPL